ncbi:unnamed protein product [Lactuca virosa]|uniref:Glutaredoxin domain-containing protein n=1 Tax=Lactuca virosa TaxID=75947 RepID=A0AAU9LVY7_9ASTR|nr:unnamed protein product [Lactuca virosa]
MWRSRGRNNSNNNNSSPKVRKIPSNPDFNHQSFKDIETLFPHGSVSDLNTIPEEPSSSSHNCSTAAAAVSVAKDVKRPTIFHRVHLATRITRAFSARPKPAPEEVLSEPNQTVAAEKSENLEKSVIPEKIAKVEEPVKSDPPITIPGADKRVVVYMTSLRVVRSTFEACRTVRSILQGFRVPVDERDLSMDSAFFDEIRKIMAQIGEGRSDDKRVDLPKVFIGGRYIGGADEVVELHEIGELKKFVKGLPAVTPGVCKFCGGFRFILCLECNGSHKCHTEDGVFITCTVCNENGLVRCPSCLSS